MDIKELEGKIAIVTCACILRGIGRATAVQLAKMGAKLIITGTGRSPESYPEAPLYPLYYDRKERL